jgi:hypothetical protein
MISSSCNLGSVFFNLGHHLSAEDFTAKDKGRMNQLCHKLCFVASQLSLVKSPNNLPSSGSVLFFFKYLI